MQRFFYGAAIGVLFIALANSLGCEVWGADAPAILSLPNFSVSPGTAPGAPPLTLDDAVRIALENHSSIKSAAYLTQAQDALVKQQMAQYYPTVTFTNRYNTSNVGGRTDNAAQGFDTLSSLTNVTMTLYNFGKREGAVQAARDTLEATQFSYNATSNNTVLGVKQAYYGVLQANALLRVNEETIRDREATLKQTQSFYDVGTRPRSDVTQAEANLYLAQANLIQSQAGVDVAWSTLRNAMGVDEFARQPLAEDLSLMPFPFSLDQSKEEAFATRPEILQQIALLKAQDQQIAVSRRKHLPDFTFDSSYGRRNSHSPIYPLTPAWLVGVTLTIPIFNGFQTTNEVQQGLSTYESLKEQLRLQKQQVALQVEQNYFNLAAFRDIVRANEAAVRAAKENLDLHEARYQVGYAAIVEVTSAQTTYTTAQTNYVNSVIAYKLAVAQLLNAIGRQ